MSCSDKDGPHTHWEPTNKKCKECGDVVEVGVEHKHRFKCRDCGEEWTD